MPITFNCPGCGKAYKVPDSVAGRPTKCRDCGKSIIIPQAGAPTEAFANAPMAPVAQVAPAGPSILEERATAPASRKGLPIKLIGLIAAAFVVVVLLGGLGYALLGGSSSPEGMKYMPDNCQMLVSVRVADFMKSGAWADVKKQFPDIEKALDKALKESPMKPEDISQLLVGFSDVGKEEMVIVVETKKAVKVEDVIAAINKVDITSKELKQSKVGDYTVHGNDKGALCQVKDTLLIAGKPAAVKAVLERNKKPQFSEGMQQALKDADLSQTFALAVSVKDVLKNPDVARDAKDSPVDVSSVETVAATISIGSDVRINWVAGFKDAKTAEEYKKMAEAGLIALKKMGGNNISKEFVEIIDAVKFDQKSTRLTMDLRIQTGPTLTAVKSEPSFLDLFMGRRANSAFGTVGASIGRTVSGGGK